MKCIFGLSKKEQKIRLKHKNCKRWNSSERFMLTIQMDSLRMEIAFVGYISNSTLKTR
jgi:hypothetical protein